MSMTGGSIFLHVGPLLPYVVISVLFAIGAYHVAGRMGRNRWLWVLGTVVPVVNFFFYIYAMFAVLLYVLDRLNEITTRPSAAQERT